MPVIVLPRPLVNQLLHHAQLDDSHEICGLISLRSDGSHVIYPIDNVAGQPHSHFEMDPKAQIETLRTLRENGECLFAIYHSHPTADAHPSAEDLRHSEYPEAARLIISLNTKGVLELRGYRINGDQSEELEVVLPE